MILRAGAHVQAPKAAAPRVRTARLPAPGRLLRGCCTAHPRRRSVFIVLYYVQQRDMRVSTSSMRLLAVCFGMRGTRAHCCLRNLLQRNLSLSQIRVPSALSSTDMTNAVGLGRCLHPDLRWCMLSAGAGAAPAARGHRTGARWAACGDAVAR